MRKLRKYAKAMYYIFPKFQSFSNFFFQLGIPRLSYIIGQFCVEIFLIRIGIGVQKVEEIARARSKVHLINNSRDPNRYSRVINVNNNQHIIIFAKRDITQWDELTYDYRFLSIDIHHTCCYGSLRCRGVVNDIKTKERISKQYAPSNKLIDWDGE